MLKIKYKSRYLFFASIAVSLLLVSCKQKNTVSDAYGNFEAVEVTVSAESAGQIQTLNVDEGLAIEAGKLVAIIDTTDLILKRLQLLAQKKAVAVKSSGVAAQIEVQKQQKANLQVEKDRLTRLVAEKAATPKQLDDINGSLRLVDKQMESIRTQNTGIFEELDVLDKQIAQINRAIDKCHVLNPVAGTVLVKYAEAGEITAPGKALYKISDLSHMVLKVYVSGSQLASIKLGQEVEVLIDAGQKTNKKYSGKISWISPVAEFTPKIIQTKEERVNLVYGVKIEVPNDGSLKIAMPAEVNFKSKLDQ